MIYLSSDLSSGISGAKSITFNAVGIGSSLRVSKEEAAKYNVTDHVNSLDWVGMYGIQLGHTVRHIDSSDLGIKDALYSLHIFLISNK